MININTIQLAIEQLFKDSAANKGNIEKGKNTSKSLRNEIQTLSIELERNTFSLHASEYENLTRSKTSVSKDDCNFLNTSIDKISKHVEDSQTDQALALSEKLVQNVTLLRKRLQYIAELEQLLKEYEQEKSIQAKLKAVAEILGLPLQIEEQVNETPPSETNQISAISDTYRPDQPSSTPTLH